MSSSSSSASPRLQRLWLAYSVNDCTKMTCPHSLHDCGGRSCRSWSSTFMLYNVCVCCQLVSTACSVSVYWCSCTRRCVTTIHIIHFVTQFVSRRHNVTSRHRYNAYTITEFMFVPWRLKRKLTHSPRVQTDAWKFDVNVWRLIYLQKRFRCSTDDDSIS